MRFPVKKLGPYMAMTCHWIPSLADACEWPHMCIASGAAVGIGRRIPIRLKADTAAA